MIKVGVVGATGYTGEELIEVLLRNPEVKITYMASRVEKDTDYASLYPRLGKRITVPLRSIDVDKIAAECELVFLALPHTVSMGIAPKFIEKGKKVIDMSADYRLPADKYEKWYAMPHTDVANLSKAVYGLPELNRDKIKNARFIANPGCYPTSVILGLLPIISDVARNKSVIIVDSKSGVTGAGRKALTQLLFGEVAENFKSYKANEHQHIPEMEYILSGACGKDVQVNFTPHLLPIRRGILSTIYIKHDGLPPAQELYDKYVKMYAHEPYTRVCPFGEHPQVKDVAGTNFCDVGIKVARGMVIIVSVIDNLLKGASGQAVQNMNIMYGIDERAGLL